MGGTVGRPSGAIEGGAIGAIWSGRIGTTELAESHKGICRHCPPVQSNFHWQAAWALPAIRNASANVTIFFISGPR